MSKQNKNKRKNEKKDENGMDIRNLVLVETQELDTKWNEGASAKLFQSITNGTKNPQQATRDVFSILCRSYAYLLGKGKEERGRIKHMDELIKRLYDSMDQFATYADIKTQRAASVSLETGISAVRNKLADIADELKNATHYSVPAIHHPSKSQVVSAGHFYSSDPPVSEVHASTPLFVLSALRSTRQTEVWSRIASIGTDLFSPLSFMTATTLKEHSTGSRLRLNRNKESYQSTLTEKVEETIRKAYEQASKKPSKSKSDVIALEGSEFMYLTRVAMEQSVVRFSNDVPNEVSREVFRRKLKRSMYYATAEIKRVRNENKKQTNRGFIQRQTQEKEDVEFPPLSADAKQQPQQTTPLPTSMVIMDPYSVLIHHLELFIRRQPRKHAPSLLYKKINDGEVHWSEFGLQMLLELFQSFEDEHKVRPFMKRYIDLLHPFMDELKQLSVVSVPPQPPSPSVSGVGANNDDEDTKKTPRVEIRSDKDSFEKIIRPASVVAHKQNTRPDFAGLPLAAAPALDIDDRKNASTATDTTVFSYKQSRFSDKLSLVVSAIRRPLSLSLRPPLPKPASEDKKGESEPLSIGMEQTFNFASSLSLDIPKLQSLSEEIVCDRDVRTRNGLHRTLTEIKEEAACLTAEFADNDQNLSSGEGEGSKMWNHRAIHGALNLLEEILDHYAVSIYAALPKDPRVIKVSPHPWMAFHPIPTDFSQPREDSFLRLPVSQRIKVYRYWMSLYGRLSLFIKQKKPAIKLQMEDDLNSLLAFYPSGQLASHPLSADIHSWGRLAVSPMEGWDQRLSSEMRSLTNVLFKRYCHALLLEFMCLPDNRLIFAFDAQITNPWNQFLGYMKQVDTDILFGPSDHYLGLKTTLASKLAYSSSFSFSESTPAFSSSRLLSSLSSVPPSLAITQLMQWTGVQFQLTSAVQKYYSYVGWFHARAHLDEWFASLLFTDENKSKFSGAVTRLHSGVIEFAVSRTVTLLSDSVLSDSNTHTETFIVSKLNKKEEEKKEIKGYFIQPVMDMFIKEFPLDHLRSSYKRTELSKNERESNTFVRRVVVPFLSEVLQIAYEGTKRLLQRENDANPRKRLIETNLFRTSIDLVVRVLQQTKSFRTKMDREWNSSFLQSMVSIEDPQKRQDFEKVNLKTIYDIRNHIHAGRLRAATKTLHQSSKWIVPSRTSAAAISNTDTLLYLSNGKEVWTGGLVRPASEFSAEYQNSLKHYHQPCLCQHVAFVLSTPHPISPSSSPSS